MDTQTAQPLELQCVTVEELMLDQKEVIGVVYWRWVSPDHDPGPEYGWITHPVPRQLTVRHLYHLINLAFDGGAWPNRRNFSRKTRVGLEFKVVVDAAGKFAVISSDDAVKYVFSVSRMRSSDGFVRAPRPRVGLCDAMREQGAHQVGLDTAML